MKITKIICSKGRTGFYFDDQKAIKQGAKTDGNMYIGEPVTKGLRRSPSGESVSVMLVRKWRYSHRRLLRRAVFGRGRRDPLFLADKYCP